MREITIVPIALVCYVISVVAILVFCQWFFDRPEDWPYLIPIITSSVSFAVACNTAEENFQSKAAARLTAIIIAAFWVIFVIVDIAGGINDIIDILAGKHPKPDEIDFIMYVVDVLLNSKIFAVVSCLLAAAESDTR